MKSLIGQYMCTHIYNGSKSLLFFIFWSLQWNWGQLTLRLTNQLKFVLFLYNVLLVLHAYVTIKLIKCDFVLRDNFLCFLQSWNEYLFFFYFFCNIMKINVNLYYFDILVSSEKFCYFMNLEFSYIFLIINKKIKASIST